MFKRSLARLTEAHVNESNQKNGLLIESIDGVESVKAAAGEWKMLDRWLHLTATVAEDELQIRRRTVLSSNLTQALQQAAYVGLVAVFSIAAGLLYGAWVDGLSLARIGAGLLTLAAALAAGLLWRSNHRPRTDTLKGGHA